MDNLPNINPESPGVDSTEQRIFDAARELFVQKGLDGAKMQEIADRAGINKALLHYYYRTKEKLFEMVVKAVINRAFPAVRQLLESEEPLEQKIIRFVDFYIDLISRNTFVPLFIITELNRQPDRFFETIFPKDMAKPEVFFRQVEEEIALGNIHPVKPQHLLVNIVSLCVFPFVAKPMFRVILGLSQPELNQFIAERKEEVKRFVFQAIKVQH